MPAQPAIKVTVNGDRRSIPQHADVADLLREMDLDPGKPRGIAVAVNDAVVPRNQWRGKRLIEGDRVEVITARQGG